MENLKHTPKEWELQGSYDIVSNSKEVSGNIVCCAPVGFNDSIDYWEANAKLIAAAPELLEALIEVYFYMFDNRLDADLTNKVLNAINKATK